MCVSLQKSKSDRIMKELFFNTIQEFNDFMGVETLHPLVSVVRVENCTFRTWDNSLEAFCLAHEE